MTKVTFSSNHPIVIELVPPTYTTAEPNVVLFEDDLTPHGFAMDFHTYQLSGSNLLVDPLIPVDQRILSNPTFTYNNALAIAANTVAPE